MVKFLRLARSKDCHNEDLLGNLGCCVSEKILAFLLRQCVVAVRQVNKWRFCLIQLCLATITGLVGVPGPEC